MNNGYEHAIQYQLSLYAYPHGKRVMALACERVIMCRVRAFTLFPEIPWRVTFNLHYISLKWSTLFVCADFIHLLDTLLN